MEIFLIAIIVFGIYLYIRARRTFQGIRQVQQQMRDAFRQAQQQQRGNPSQSDSQRDKVFTASDGEYVDFEEHPSSSPRPTLSNDVLPDEPQTTDAEFIEIPRKP